MLELSHSGAQRVRTESRASLSSSSPRHGIFFFFQGGKVGSLRLPRCQPHRPLSHIWWPFCGHFFFFFVRGVAVSGGEGVQRKVVVWRKLHVFPSPPSCTGGVSSGVLRFRLLSLKDDFSPKTRASGLVKERRTSQERAQTLPTPLLGDIHNLSLTGGTQSFTSQGKYFPLFSHF